MFASFRFNPRPNLSCTFRSTPAPSLPRFVRSIDSPSLEAQGTTRHEVMEWRREVSVKADSVPDDSSPRSRLLFLRHIRRVVGGLDPLVGLGRRSPVRLGEELREERRQEGPGTGSIRTGHPERILRNSDLSVSDPPPDLHD